MAAAPSFHVRRHVNGNHRGYRSDVKPTAVEAASLFLEWAGEAGSVSTVAERLIDGEQVSSERGGVIVVATPQPEYVAIDLDENNGEPVGTFGWGVCRHGHGLQAYLPRLTEHEARYLAAMLTEEASRWRPASNGAGARHWFLIRDAQASARDRYHRGASGQLVRYASHKSAQRAADRLNK